MCSFCELHQALKMPSMLYWYWFCIAIVRRFIPGNALLTETITFSYQPAKASSRMKSG